MLQNTEAADDVDAAGSEGACAGRALLKVRPPTKSSPLQVLGAEIEHLLGVVKRRDLRPSGDQRHCHSTHATPEVEHPASLPGGERSVHRRGLPARIRLVYVGG